MWNLEMLELRDLRPAEQLWVIAQAVEEHEGPTAYVKALRA
jgi:hypothetical protein